MRKFLMVNFLLIQILDRFNFRRVALPTKFTTGEKLWVEILIINSKQCTSHLAVFVDLAVFSPTCFPSFWKKIPGSCCCSMLTCVFLNSSLDSIIIPDVLSPLLSLISKHSLHVPICFTDGSWV